MKKHGTASKAAAGLVIAATAGIVTSAGCGRECYLTPHEVLENIGDGEGARCELLARGLGKDIKQVREKVNTQCTHAANINSEDFQKCQSDEVKAIVEETNKVPQECMGSFIYCSPDDGLSLEAFSCDEVSQWSDSTMISMLSESNCYLPNCCIISKEEALEPSGEPQAENPFIEYLDKDS